MPDQDSHPVAAGVAYFAVIFMLGFLLGIVRVLVLEPKAGSLTAVMLEMPVMLIASWLVCRRMLTVFRLGAPIGDRVIMGGVALSLLLIAELGLSLGVMGNSLADHLAHYRTAPGVLGLSGQLAFAAMPLFVMRRTNRREEP